MNKILSALAELMPWWGERGLGGVECCKTTQAAGRGGAGRGGALHREARRGQPEQKHLAGERNLHPPSSSHPVCPVPPLGLTAAVATESCPPPPPFTPAIEDEYSGPKLEDGKVTVTFMKELMQWYKDQKKLHRKCAYQVRPRQVLHAPVTPG